ncbi:hypothetical protein J3R82DRAFT_6904 [Butyriboletus roseoflavus]|nr:hypothetical protein J3R82DRAFT_6904 [Butyriboletus roseoflavus]
MQNGRGGLVLRGSWPVTRLRTESHRISLSPPLALALVKPTPRSLYNLLTRRLRRAFRHGRSAGDTQSTGRVQRKGALVASGSDGAIVSHAFDRHPILSASRLSLKLYSIVLFQQPGDLGTQFNTLNVVPDPQDILLINTLISERNTQLSILALQMANVDSAIQKLAAIRAKLEENSAHARQSLLAYRALTSPATRIPPEVLGEVFYHCLSKTPYITPRDVESPIVLTQVCRRWRAVAISTPRLWSSLSIYLQKADCEEYRRGCEAWLARAKSVPLAVRVLNDINMFAAESTVVSSVAHWLRPFITHSNDLWWHGPTIPTLFVSETETGTDLSLERLRITSHRDPPSIHFPGPAKGLRSASLRCLNHDLQSLDGIELPWDHLIELNMHFALFSSSLFVQLLTRCGHLHTLVISCLCADEDQLGVLRALSPGLITHPFLRRIEIKVIRAGLDAILNALTLPALEELDICFCYRERDMWPHAQFMEMVGRSRCPLRRLTVRSNKNALPYFGEYMETIPELTISTSAPDHDPLSRLVFR